MTKKQIRALVWAAIVVLSLALMSCGCCSGFILGAFFMAS